jgi:hypothetical protein
MPQVALQKRSPDPLWVAILRKSRPQGAGTTIFARRVSGQKPADDFLHAEGKIGLGKRQARRQAKIVSKPVKNHLTPQENIVIFLT